MTDLTRWVKVRKKPKPKPKRRVSGLMLRFLQPFPEGIMTPNGPIGPIRVGDLVSLEVVGEDVARVLIEQEAVEVYHMEVG